MYFSDTKLSDSESRIVIKSPFLPTRQEIFKKYRMSKKVI